MKRNLKSVRRVALRLRESAKRLIEFATTIENWAVLMEKRARMQSILGATVRMEKARDRAIRAIMSISQAITKLKHVTEGLKIATTQGNR